MLDGIDGREYRRMCCMDGLTAAADAFFLMNGRYTGAKRQGKGETRNNEPTPSRASAGVRAGYEVGTVYGTTPMTARVAEATAMAGKRTCVSAVLKKLADDDGV